MACGHMALVDENLGISSLLGIAAQLKLALRETGVGPCQRQSAKVARAVWQWLCSHIKGYSVSGH